MEVVPEEVPAQAPSLQHIFSIWPIAETIAQHSTVAGVINLARTSSNMRSVLHGGLSRTQPRKAASDAHLRPEVGEHQTPYWVSLKRVSPVVCASSTHTRGHNARGCVYCSMPICEACIVRDSFKHPNENTFRNRLRYLCKDCWTEGRPVKNFRFNPAPSTTKPKADDTRDDVDNSNGNTDGDDNNNIESESIPDFCRCTLKENGWLCLDCKHAQNSSELASTHLTQSREVKCYGVMCSGSVDLSASDKDTRRICRWCEKPVRRQMGSEGLYRLQRDFAHMSALRAASRKLDMAEYHKQRQREMKMSRFDMRGDNGSKDPDLLRHLDCVNYRNYMSDASCPSPDAVWKSKMGIWTYNKNFLLSTGRRVRHISLRWDINHSPSPVLDSETAENLRAITRQGALPFARTNEALRADIEPRNSLSLKLDDIWPNLVLLKPHIMEMYANSTTKPPNTLKQLWTDVTIRYEIVISLPNFGHLMRSWLTPSYIQRRRASVVQGTKSRNNYHEDDYIETVISYNSQLAEAREAWGYSARDVVASDLHDLASVESDELNAGLGGDEDSEDVVIEDDDEIEGDKVSKSDSNSDSD